MQQIDKSAQAFAQGSLLDLLDEEVDLIPIDPGADEFEAFHAANPDVYSALVALARKFTRQIQSGQIGMQMLIEVLRWQVMVSTTDAEYKINNNHGPHYARLIMRQEPDLDGVFITRRRRVERGAAA